MTAQPQAERPAVLPTCSPAVFKALCEARAYLVAIGETEMNDAVDSLQELAENGLVQQIDQDAVQAIMSAAFERVEASMAEPVFEPSEDLPIAPIDSPNIAPQSPRLGASGSVASAAELQRNCDRSIKQARIDGGPAASTIMALEYLIAQNDPAGLRTWLAKRPGEERRALKLLMVPT
jgi:hypothetical protein